MFERGGDCDYEIEKIAYAHEIAHQFPIRERFWLNELKQANAGHILFVCGDIHLRTFPKLLKVDGIESEIIKEGIGVSHSAKEYVAFDFAESSDMFDQADCFCRKKLLIDKMS
jgi:hypothetical protein